MKKTTIQAFYTCDFCDFKSESPKITGKHEANCEHNTGNIEKMQKRNMKNKIYNSATLEEASQNIYDYLNTYNQTALRGRSANSFKLRIGDWDRKQISCNEKSLLSHYGIEIEANLFPNLFKDLETINEFKKLQNEQTTKYNHDRENEINLKLYTNENWKNLKAIKSNLDKEWEQLDIKRQKNKQDLADFERNFIDNFKNNWGYIDYSGEISKLKNKFQ